MKYCCDVNYEWLSPCELIHSLQGACYKVCGTVENLCYLIHCSLSTDSKSVTNLKSSWIAVNGKNGPRVPALCNSHSVFERD